MTDHLPECPIVDKKGYPFGGPCICAALRACEQRCYALGIEVGKHDGWIAGHTAGLSAARDAVNDSATVLEALAAIDALRGEA